MCLLLSYSSLYKQIISNYNVEMNVGTRMFWSMEALRGK